MQPHAKQNDSSINQHRRMFEKISERFTVVDGFVVKKEKDGSRKVVNVTRGLARPTKEERAKISVHRLQDLSFFLAQSDELLPCSSRMLFETADTVRKLFYRSPNGYKAVVKRRTKSPDIKKAREFEVIPINYPHKKFRFLYLNSVDDACISDHEDSRAEAVLSKNNSMVFKMLHIEELPLLDEDYEVLKEYQFQRLAYAKECEEMFRHAYDLAMKINVSRLLTPSFADRVNGEPLLKKLQYQTVKKYGRDMGETYFVLVNLDRMPLRQYVRGLSVNSDLLNDCVGQSHRIPEKIEYLHEMHHKMLAEDTMTDLVHVLLRMMPLTLERNSDSRELTVKNLYQIRIHLQSLMAWIKYSEFSQRLNGSEELFEEGGSTIWRHLRRLFRIVAKEADKTPRYSIEYYGSDSVRVAGKEFSRGYIRSFYYEVKQQFDELWEEIDKVYLLGTIKTVGDMLLESRFLKVENKGKPFFSIESLFPTGERISLFPSPRTRPTVLHITTVLDAIDKMTVLLMWMVWFAAGPPYRYPELQTLAYAGKQRNIFIDMETRCVQIRTNYNKNGKFTNIVKLLDRCTSRYVIYYIMVLRLLQRRLLGVGLRCMPCARMGMTATITTFSLSRAARTCRPRRSQK
ncbi:LAFE_0E00298g1_1 [Lachancea fermentati]|uniref:LAFE_0E00298g1_1 n=1 Tax=Lachancea fermentati TaxID=4955 RepID=A0A1G4MCC7_LACFM|nr:LAFE_0E00298g1_1 [Lachancea fermentati]